MSMTQTLWRVGGGAVMYTALTVVLPPLVWYQYVALGIFGGCYAALYIQTEGMD